MTVVQHWEQSTHIHQLFSDILQILVCRIQKTHPLSIRTFILKGVYSSFCIKWLVFFHCVIEAYIYTRRGWKASHIFAYLWGLEIWSKVKFEIWNWQFYKISLSQSEEFLDFWAFYFFILKWKLFAWHICSFSYYHMHTVDLCLFINLDFSKILNQTVRRNSNYMKIIYLYFYFFPLQKWMLCWRNKDLLIVLREELISWEKNKRTSVIYFTFLYTLF